MRPRTWGYLGHLGRPFADGGSFSRMHCCTGLTSIARFCFRKIGSRHSIVINLIGRLSVSFGCTRICRTVWILSSRTVYTFEANVSFLEGSLDHLRPGGIYVAEDIMWSDVDKWYDRLEAIYSKKYPTYEFAFVVLANRGCDNLLVVRRAAY